MIRKYQMADTDALVSIWQAASALAHPFLDKDFLAGETENLRNLYLPSAETWVATDRQTPVGFIALVGHDIGGLFVEPRFHGQGWGRSLVDFAVKETGPLHVDVFEKNAIGRRFYSRYGFIESGRYRHQGSGEITLRFSLPQTG